MVFFHCTLNFFEIGQTIYTMMYFSEKNICRRRIENFSANARDETNIDTFLFFWVNSSIYFIKINII